MGLTAQRDRANPAAVPQCIVAMPFELKPGISSDIVRQIEYWFSHFKTITPLERADDLLAYKEQRQAERERMLELRRQRLARDEGGE